MLGLGYISALGLVRARTHYYGSIVEMTPEQKFRLKGMSK